MDKEKEASLRDVLAEVSVLDLWAATKLIFTQWGCLAALVLIGALMANVGTFVTGSSQGLGIPNWAIWLFITWAFLAAYTENASYHEHRFAWYFPKTGWLWSLPLAGYLVIGVQLYRGGDPQADFLARIAHTAILAAWWFPFFLGIAVLEIGHNRVMEKRSSVASSEPHIGERLWEQNEDD